jgi:pimeloyl-ACP methyl ester carboxylesterase
MAYLEIGRGRPLVCVHGTLGDFRTWSAVMGPLSKKHRVIAVSLRHFFPEHWDGVGNDYLMAQHVADMIGFLERLGDGPVDLMGHSRGGHISFRVAQQRPDLLRRLVLAEPGGELDATLDPTAAPDGAAQRAARFAAGAAKVADGDVEGALKLFFETIEGDGAWGPSCRRAQAAVARQCLHLDRAGRREPEALCKDRSAIDQGSDLVHRRYRDQGKPARCAARTRSPGTRRQDRDDRRRRTLDVRAGAAGFLRDRDRIPEGVTAAPHRHARR